MIEIPAGFAENMRTQLGTDEAQALLTSLDTTPCTGIRMNIGKGVEAPAQSSPVPWNSSGYTLAQRPNFTLDPAWHQGRYYVQEPASMFAGTIVEKAFPRTERIKALDLCAAPGGKTTAVADALPEGSLLIANEFVARRAEILSENVQKWGRANIVVTRGDTGSLCRALEGCMDLVVADVPCSGEGMMRKEEEARRQWSPTLVQSCATLQREIAANGALALRNGGLMLYSTCTFNAEENEENVRWICSELGFETVDIPVEETWNLRSHGSGLHFYPHLTGSEGLYVCLLRKIASSAKARLPKRLPNPIKENLPWVNLQGLKLYKTDSCLYALTEEYLPYIQAAGRQVLLAGIPVAAVGKRGWEPMHAIAMSTLLRRGTFPELSLNRQQALHFLACRTDNLPETSTRGYVLVTYHDYPLGWVKALGNRYNNLYPRNWRIRQTVT